MPPNKAMDTKKEQGLVKNTVRLVRSVRDKSDSHWIREE